MSVPAFRPHSGPDHDESLIARLAADDLGAREAIAARTLVEACPGCAELLSDLRQIARAARDLPTPRRQRDFRLTDADAARLRPNPWRGLLARFAEPSFGFLRPLATGLVGLGFVGLLLAALPGPFGSAGIGTTAESGRNAGGAPGPVAPALGSAPTSAAAGASPAALDGSIASPAASDAKRIYGSNLPSPSAVDAGPVASPHPSDFVSPAATTGAQAYASSPGTEVSTAPKSGAGAAAAPPGGPSGVLVVACVLLGAGLGLFLLRWSAGRFA